MGDAICEELICDVCWDKGYDKHSNNDTAYIYYYVKYQLYEHLPDFLPVVQSNAINWPK